MTVDEDGFCPHCGFDPEQPRSPVDGPVVTCWSCQEPIPQGDESDDGDEVRVVRTVRASEIRPQRTRWLFDGLIPLGSITVLAGVQGLGKSTLAVELAARATRGDLEGDLKGKPRAVLYASAEDHLAAPLVPRFMAADADLDRVHFPEVTEVGEPAAIELPDDAEGLVQAVEKTDRLKLVVIDPTTAFLSGDSKVDTHREGDVRQVLARISAIAEHKDIALLLIHHLNKTTATSDPLLQGLRLGGVYRCAPQRAHSRLPSRGCSGCPGRARACPREEQPGREGTFARVQDRVSRDRARR